MKIRSVLSLLCAVFLIAGCAGMEKYKYNGNSYDYNNSDVVASLTKKTTDNYSKKSSFSAPILHIKNEGSLSSIIISREPGPDSKVVISILDTYFRDWRFYNRAIDSDGRELEFHSVERDVSYCYARSCTYKESFAIIVPQYYLERKSGGMNFKVYGRTDQVFNIPGGYISGFVKATWDK